MFKIENILLFLIVIVCFLVSLVLVMLVVKPEIFPSPVYASEAQEEELIPVKEISDEDWQVYLNEDFAFEISYPDTVIQKSALDQDSLNAGVGVSPGTPVWQFRLDDEGNYQGTNLIDASLVIHVGNQEGDTSRCSEFKPGSINKIKLDAPPVVEINGISFWKDVVQEGVMGGSYYQVSYRAVSQGACYEITQVIQSSNQESFAGESVSSFDLEKVTGKLDKVLETFEFLDVVASFPPQSYPEPKSVEGAVEKSATEHVDGLDVSHWQGDINWEKVANNDYIFTFVKGTEGVGWTDVKFFTNINEGTEAGVVMGVYHFARPDLGNTGQEEAEYFLSVVGDYLESGYLRPVLDLEVGSYLGKNALSAWVLDWLQTVENQSGVAPLIYTNYNYISYFLTDPVANYDLWIAYWNCNPTPTFDIPPTGMWSDWGFWQYCVKPAGTVPGIRTPIDMNIFNGVEEGLSEFDAASPLWVSLTNYTTAAPSPHYADITADVNGDAVGIINYAFWWDCTSLEVNITAASASCGELPAPVEGECLENEYGVRCNAVAEEVKMVEHTYQEVGDFTAKVIVERDTAPPAEDRYHITVYNPILSITPDPISPGESQLNQLFQMSVEVEIDTSLSGALQVEIFENGQEAAIDQGCQTVGQDVRTTKTYDFSFSESEVGLKNYTIWARYQPGQECPILDISADDRSEPYIISWGFPEVEIQGNGNLIPDGSLSTLISNGTDFGKIKYDGEIITHGFSILSSGEISVELSGNPYVAISGINAADFSVDIQPVSPIQGGGTSSFEISFDPSESGVREAMISISNNDSDENPYDFVIQGIGTHSSEVSLVLADFDGDEDSDISVYRPQNGHWFIKGKDSVWWGLPGDLPVPGDYDGDGAVDIAIYRPSNGKWFVFPEEGIWWGLPGDVPMQGDYSGNQITDLAVYRPSNGKWYVYGEEPVKWGLAGDIPVPGDYDGDGTQDIAVYRTSTGYWYVYGEPAFSVGTIEGIPVPGDYNGDGVTNIAVYQPETGEWFIDGEPSIWWGLSGDIPVPGDYDGDGDMDITVLRPSNGKWYILGQSPIWFYREGDYPLVIRDTNADGDPYH